MNSAIDEARGPLSQIRERAVGSSGFRRGHLLARRDESCCTCFGSDRNPSSPARVTGIRKGGLRPVSRQHHVDSAAHKHPCLFFSPRRNSYFGSGAWPVRIG